MVIISVLLLHIIMHAGIVVGIATAMNWGSTYIFTQTFPSILASFQTFGTLYMLSFINLAAALFFLFLLPETKV